MDQFYNHFYLWSKFKLRESKKVEKKLYLPVSLILRLSIYVGIYFQ